MATATRTYLPTDWKVFTYQPTPGVFRLDFSKWDDGNDWGSPTAGGMAEITGKIAEIVLQDGNRADDGFTFEIQPATASVTLIYETFSKSTMAEFYNGKRIVIALANPSTSGGIFGSYGRNTIFFEGFITNSSIELDPESQITTVQFTATDFLSIKLNTIVTQIRSSIALKGDSIGSAEWRIPLQQAFPYTDSYWYISLEGTLSNANDFSNTPKTVSVGEILRDYCVSNMAYSVNSWSYGSISSGIWTRRTRLITLNSAGSSAYDFPEDRITAIQLGNDAVNNPNGFSFTNFDNSTYQIGAIDGNSLSGNVAANLTVDLMNTQAMQDIVNKFREYRSAFRPINVTVEIARTYQPITYTNTSGGEFLRPDNMVSNGTVARFDLTSFGYTLDETKSIIIGQTHTITPDTWLCDYQLMKGI